MCETYLSIWEGIQTIFKKFGTYLPNCMESLQWGPHISHIIVVIVVVVMVLLLILVILIINLSVDISEEDCIDLFN
jgi:hypothetical protein